MSEKNGGPPEENTFRVSIEPGFTGQVVLHCREGEVKKYEVSARGRVVDGPISLTGNVERDSSSDD